MYRYLKYRQFIIGAIYTVVIKLFKIRHAGKEILIHKMYKGRDYSARDLKRKRLLRKKLSQCVRFLRNNLW